MSVPHTIESLGVDAKLTKTRCLGNVLDFSTLNEQ